MSPTTFWELKALNRAIYQEANDRVYPHNLDILLKIVSCASIVASKGISDGNRDITIHYSVMTMSWAMAWANRMNRFDIADKLYEHFTACPYCKGKPCECKKRIGPKPKRTLFAVTNQPPQSVLAFQGQIAEIYPQNTLVKAGNHLAAEAVELAIAVTNYERWGHDPAQEPFLLANVCEEYCDVQAHLAAVAHCDKFDLAGETLRTFRDGCCACHLPKCKCGYTAPRH